MMMRDAVRRVKAHFGKKADELDETAIPYLLWEAADELARETCVTVKHYDITLAGTQSYAIDRDRIRRVFEPAVHINGTVEWPVRLAPVQEFKLFNTSPSTMAGSPMTHFCVPEDGLVLVYPLGTTGATLRIPVTKTPIMQSRDSTRVDVESATAGTTTTTTVTALSHIARDGKLANNGTVSDYFEDCIIQFGLATTTTALRGQKARITNYAESTGVLTHSALSVGAASGDVFTVHDVLDVNELYAPLCILYACGMLGDEKSLMLYERRFADAKKKKYGMSTERGVGRIGARQDIWD